MDITSYNIFPFFLYYLELPFPWEDGEEWDPQGLCKFLNTPIKISKRLCLNLSSKAPEKTQ